MKEIRLVLETVGNKITIYSNSIPVATAEFGAKEITLKTIYHETTTTWKDTAAMFDYIKKEHDKFINSSND